MLCESSPGRWAEALIQAMPGSPQGRCPRCGIRYGGWKPTVDLVVLDLRAAGHAASVGVNGANNATESSLRQQPKVGYRYGR